MGADHKNKYLLQTDLDLQLENKSVKAVLRKDWLG